MDAVLAFLLQFLRLEGFAPRITSCAKCGASLTALRDLFFAAQSGGALCPFCAKGAKRVSSLSLEAMRRILLLEFAGIQNVKLPPQTRAELFDVLVTYTESMFDRKMRTAAQLSVAY